MDKSCEVTALGELNVDIILNDIDGFPEMGKEKFAGKMTVALGSSTAIFAANVACLGARTAFAGMVGRDSFGSLVSESLRAKGVDTIYEEESPLKDHIRRGEFSLHRGDVPQTVVGAGLAYNLGINPKFIAPVEMYFPSRTRNISLSNPAASIESVKVYPSGVFSINNEIDNELLIVPIEKMRELLEYDDEVSAVELRMTGASSKEIKRVKKGIEERLGPSFKVSDRFEQNTALYKMMKYEKASIYLILIFVIIIIAFNIFGSLSMLIIEKRGDIMTFRSMGATDRLLKKIFVLEGWLISLLGMAAGLVLGIGFALLQQHFGFIKMPGNFIIQAYPVIISWKDVLITAAGVAAIGYLIALLPVASFYRKEEKPSNP